MGQLDLFNSDSTKYYVYHGLTDELLFVSDYFDEVNDKIGVLLSELLEEYTNEYISFVLGHLDEEPDEPYLSLASNRYDDIREIRFSYLKNTAK